MPAPIARARGRRMATTRVGRQACQIDDLSGNRAAIGVPGCAPRAGRWCPQTPGGRRDDLLRVRSAGSDGLWTFGTCARSAAMARVSVPTRRLNGVDLGEVLDAAPERIRRTNLPRRRLGRDHELVTL